MSKKKKSVKQQLADGADEIHKAQEEAAPLVVPKATREQEDVIRDRVTVLPGHVGLKIADDTPIEESMQILDWTTQMSEHIGFCVGDVLNFGESKWGEKYAAALNRTGRSYNTLVVYARVAKRIPAEKRLSTLTFSHYVELTKLADVGEIEKVAKEVAKPAVKGGDPLPVKEVRDRVKKLLPKKEKKVKADKPKKKKAPKPEPPPYEPTEEEQSKMDVAETALGEANDAIKSGGVFKIVGKCDNGEKKRWLKLLEPLKDFYYNLDRITGY
jgi:hypothetical protein